MKKLKYFLLGLLTAEVGLSLIDSIAGVALQGLELWKGKLQIKLAKMQVDYEKIKNGETPASVGIGFSIPSEIEEDYEGEDEQ